MNKAIATAITMLCLSGCGSSSDSGGSNRQDFSKLKQARASTSTLTKATPQQLERSLKNGLRLQASAGYGSGHGDAIDFLANETAMEQSDLSEANQDSRFSMTNTHVAGIDEADWVKYDGEYLYLSRMIAQEQVVHDEIRIVKTDPSTASAQEVSRFPAANAEPFGYFDGLSLGNNVDNQLYLDANAEGKTETLITLSSSWQDMTWDEQEASTDIARNSMWRPTNATLLTLYDVQTPAQPTASVQLKIDGHLMHSRKIDNMLYIVNQYYALPPELNFAITSDADLDKTAEQIDDLTLNELTPLVSINGATPVALHPNQDCYLPTGTSVQTGNGRIISIIAIDVKAKTIVSTACLNSHISGMYMSGSALYLGASDYVEFDDGEFGDDNRIGIEFSADTFTVVHKFNLDKALSYMGTGAVPGTLGWQDPAFRMDEYEGALRIVTTERGEGGIKHQLTVLGDGGSDKKMITLATLPNAQRPAPIGKPGEDIYAVRFDDDRAFIVTFLQIDPLYVIDLSEATDPKIEGELEVPGFSTYLHPVDDNYLLGVGNANFGKLKVSLYDISNTSMPTEINSISFDYGSYSSANYDLRALSFLRHSDDQLRFTLPLTYYGRNNDNTTTLQQFEINGLSSNSATLTNTGEIVAQTDSPYSSTYRDRGILHGDTTFFSQAGNIWAAFWQSPETATGPY